MIISPYFSILIMAYNREHCIARAINSCLNQEFNDYEIVFVDDGSTDNTIEIVKSFKEMRIRIIRQEHNLGMIITKNRAISEAKGKWVLFLDSDDEFIPGALSIIYNQTINLPDEIGCLRFMCISDNQLISPEPPLKEEVWDYRGYITWLNFMFGRRNETRYVVRKDIIKKLHHYESHVSTELFNFNLAALTLTKTCPYVVQVYHQDAGGQRSRPNVDKLLARGPGLVRQAKDVLSQHGDALAKWAPNLYTNKLTGLATAYFLTGKRIQGSKQIISSLKINPFSLKAWVVLLTGLVGPRTLAWIKVWQNERTRKKLY